MYYKEIEIQAKNSCAVTVISEEFTDKEEKN